MTLAADRRGRHPPQIPRVFAITRRGAALRRSQGLALGVMAERRRRPEPMIAVSPENVRYGGCAKPLAVLVEPARFGERLVRRAKAPLCRLPTGFPPAPCVRRLLPAIRRPCRGQPRPRRSERDRLGLFAESAARAGVEPDTCVFESLRSARDRDALRWRASGQRAGCQGVRRQQTQPDRHDQALAASSSAGRTPRRQGLRDPGGNHTSFRCRSGGSAHVGERSLRSSRPVAPRREQHRTRCGGAPNRRSAVAPVG